MATSKRRNPNQNRSWLELAADTRSSPWGRWRARRRATRLRNELQHADRRRSNFQLTREQYAAIAVYTVARLQRGGEHSSPKQFEGIFEPDILMWPMYASTALVGALSSSATEIFGSDLFSAIDVLQDHLGQLSFLSGEPQRLVWTPELTDLVIRSRRLNSTLGQLDSRWRELRDAYPMLHTGAIAIVAYFAGIVSALLVKR